MGMWGVNVDGLSNDGSRDVEGKLWLREECGQGHGGGAKAKIIHRT